MQAKNLERAYVGEDMKDTIGWSGALGLCTTLGYISVYTDMEFELLNCKDGSIY